ncbi:MAG: threonine synthase [Deltaproteobacteria bacterium]|nr:threonine synthase [Deltaproteobacteria bacterium]
MKLEDFPQDIKPFIIPKQEGKLVYRCLSCKTEFGIEELLYTCPDCGQLLLIEDLYFDRLKNISGNTWKRIFDYRKMLSIPQLKGVFRYYEFIGSMIPLESIVYLGEGHTPIVEASPIFKEKVGADFYFKNDGQNPSASFKDRGMAVALSYLNYLIQQNKLSDIIAVCASTGDTSAAAALYASYLQPHIKSVVLLPHKKITSQQLSQPLGSGAVVFEIPGVFDDCMKVAESLSEKYNVALLNSKNAWRILGQESYSYEIAQDFEYDLSNIAVVLPIGNAGNITAVMSGFLKFLDAGIIDQLPKIIGVQSEHADPVYRYYLEPDVKKRKFKPIPVKPSVAQAAMIGNPVSMPRVIHFVNAYNKKSGKQNIFVAQVTEQDIMDWTLLANKHGHIACTHGGESLAGLVAAKNQGILKEEESAVIKSTAHPLKFSGFQQMYFEGNFPAEFGIMPDPKLINTPVLVCPKDLKELPSPGTPLKADQFKIFIDRISKEIASILDLIKL